MQYAHRGVIVTHAYSQSSIHFQITNQNQIVISVMAILGRQLPDTIISCTTSRSSNHSVQMLQHHACCLQVQAFK